MDIFKILSSQAHQFFSGNGSVGPAKQNQRKLCSLQKPRKLSELVQNESIKFEKILRRNFIMSIEFFSKTDCTIWYRYITDGLFVNNNGQLKASAAHVANNAIPDVQRINHSNVVIIGFGASGKHLNVNPGQFLDAFQKFKAVFSRTHCGRGNPANRQIGHVLIFFLKISQGIQCSLNRLVFKLLRAACTHAFCHPRHLLHPLDFRKIALVIHLVDRHSRRIRAEIKHDQIFHYLSLPLLQNVKIIDADCGTNFFKRLIGNFICLVAAVFQHLVNGRNIFFKLCSALANRSEFCFQNLI